MLRLPFPAPSLLLALGMVALMFGCQQPTENKAKTPQDDGNKTPLAADPEPPLVGDPDVPPPALGAYLLVDIVSGAQEGSYPQDFVEFNGTVYFTALNYDDTDKRVLYYLSGSTAVRVDTVHKIESSLTLYRNALYFLSSEPGVGQELFRCTTDNVIELVVEVRPGADNGAYLLGNDRLTVYNNWLCFGGIVDYAGTDHEELFCYKGAEDPEDAELVQVTTYGGGSAQASRMAVLGSTIYFFVNPTDPNYDTYVLGWDAEMGVSAVNLASGNNNFGQSSVPVALGSKLWFIAEGPAGGHGTNALGKSSGEYDLYSLDGEGNFALEVDFSAPSAGVGSQPVVVDGAAYFVMAESDDGAGHEWYRLSADGTVTALGNLNPVDGRGLQQAIDDSRLPLVAGLGGQLYFAAAETYDEVNDYDDVELYSWSGTGLPTKFAEIGVDEVLSTDFPSEWWNDAVIDLYPSSPQSLTTIGTKIYFQADDRLHGPELWVIESR